MRCPAILPALLLAGGLFGLAAPAASAKTSVDATIGWGETIRVGRWTPIYVTAADDTFRQVRLDVEVAQGGPYVLRLKQWVTIGPQPTTLTVYAPFREAYGDPPTVTLRDANTGKTLARWPPDQGLDGSGRFRLYDKVLQGEKRFVGVTGPGGGRLDRMENDTGAQFKWDALKPDLLPDAPVGYDALDLLVLQRVDLNKVDRDRQRAIVDWVRAGGCVLVIPSDEPMPADGPLADAVPCRPGAPTEYVFSDKVRRHMADRGRRSTGVRGFELSPKPNARPLQLWAAGDTWQAATAYAADVGFGRIIVAPFDITQMDLGGRGASLGGDLYKTLLAGTGLMDEAQVNNTNSYGVTYGLDPVGRRQETATASLQDHIGSVPGAGRFGFSYVAWVVLGMMVLVGPVDWFVLKRLGRQPWTWATTAGWIATITVGALYAGHVLKSGELHYRTVAVIDQADDRVVARTTLAGLYSPRTTLYHLDAAPTQTDAEGKPVPTNRPPVGWWDPGPGRSGGGGLKVDVPFHQTTEGNLPDPMTVNVWNLRFLRGENLVAGEPMIKASLRLQAPAAAGGPQVVRGTITNVSDVVLTDLLVRVGTRVFRPDAAAPAAAPAAGSEQPAGARNGLPMALARLAPGESAEVRGTLVEETPETPPEESSEDQSQAAAAATPVRTSRNVAALPAGLAAGSAGQSTFDPAYGWAGDLAARRAVRSEQAMADGRHAVVYARVADPKPAVVLREPGAKERHETVLRALVRLEPDPAATAGKPGAKPAAEGGDQSKP